PLTYAIASQQRTTIVPYTTLFRSEGHGDIVHESARDGGEPEHGEDDRELAVHVADHEFGEHAEGPHFIQTSGDHKKADKEHDALDRKSTRLNSSHQIISYAVFCVK